MQITSTGHAGLFIETTGGTILCDPWLYPAYFASWFVFPDNSSLDWERLGDCDFLYVSHLHHDHFDAENLSRHVSKNAMVLLPDFPVDDLKNALQSLGFTRFTHVPNNTPVELDGMRVQISALTAPNDGPLGDSALAIDDGNAIVLNQNDARPLGYGDLGAFAGDQGYDAHFLQFSGAIWYPMVYDLPAKLKTTEGIKKRANGMERAMRYATDLGARFIFPSAGPPCFLDRELWDLNDLGDDPSNVFPDAYAWRTFLESRGQNNARILIPGSTATLQRDPTTDTTSCAVNHLVDNASVDEIYNNKASYLRAYAQRQASRIAQERAAWPDPEVVLFDVIKAWFEPLLALSTQFVTGIGAPVEIVALGSDGVADESIVIDFPNRVVRRRNGDEKCRYRFRVARPLVERLVADHEIDWVNTLFLSARFEAHRAGPYNEYLYTFFKCLNEERLEYAEGWYAEARDDEARIELDGWRMQARCPHLKAELAHFGSIEGTTLTCRMHGWQWDLETGRCLTSKGHELACEWAGEPDRADD